MGDWSLPAFPVDRVWGEDAILYIMRITGHHREHAIWSLRIEIDAGKVRIYRRMSGDPEPPPGALVDEHGELSQIRPIPPQIQFERYFIDRADLEKRWEPPEPNNDQPPAAAQIEPPSPQNEKETAKDLAINAVIESLGAPPEVPWGSFWAEVLRSGKHNPDKPPNGWRLRSIQNRTKKILAERQHKAQEI